MQMELYYPNVFACFSGPGYNIPQPLPYIEKKEQIIGMNHLPLENVNHNTIDASHCILPPISSVDPVATSSNSENKKRKYTKKDKAYSDTSSSSQLPSPVVFKKHYRNVLVFDTETTGLLPKVTPENIHSPEMPRIIQLSYILFDTSTYDVKKIGNHYIKLDDGIEIPPFITEITGIQSETCKTRGVDIADALIDFYNSAMEADCIVGHNVAFDIRMIECEIERNYVKLEPIVPLIVSLFNPMYMRVKNIDVICTMKESIHVCNINKVDKNGRPYKKFPKLCEVYLHLFKSVPEHLHNALIDVIACLRCFLKVYMDKDMHDVKYNKIISNAMMDMDLR
jgi:DNA polymerase III epsilon subunit-like protein